MKGIKILGAVLFLVVAFLVGVAAFSHRLLPEDMDECQQDISHQGHTGELPAFHCIGHTEWNMETGTWDHEHPWMTEEWLEENAMPSPGG